MELTAIQVTFFFFFLFFRLHYSINPLSSQKTKTNAMVLKQKQIIIYFLSKLLEKYPMISEEVCCFVMRKPSNRLLM